MRYLYSLHGRNITPCWRVTVRRQGQQLRLMLDMGWIWFGTYWTR